MKVEVVTPEDFMGDVIGNLNARRGSSTGSRSGPPRGSSPPTSRWPRCSATPPTCVHDPGPRHLLDGVLRYSEVPQSIANELIAKSKS